jgi:hypothetical protein
MVKFVIKNWTLDGGLYITDTSEYLKICLSWILNPGSVDRKQYNFYSENKKNA